MPHIVGNIIAALSPVDVAYFCKKDGEPRTPADKLDLFGHNLDPNPMPYEPFIKSEPTDKPTVDQNDLYTVTMFSDGTLDLSKSGEAIKLEGVQKFHAAPDFHIDYDYLANSKEHPLIVDPYAAALALYDPNIGNMEKVEWPHFREAGSQRILDHIRSGGVEDPEARDFLGQAVMMDTASRTPSIMTPDFIKKAQRWYAENGEGASLWIGAGSENYLLPPGERLGALNGGKADRARYIEARREQLEFVQGLGQTPILFPDIMHHGLDDDANEKIIREILAGKEGEVILHKLGTPFVKETDWFTPELLKRIAGLGKGVKTSNPIFANQVNDYNAIMAGKGAMYTGDDRNFALVWLMGAIKQIQTDNPTPPTHERNGFHFIKDKNANALLGYIGLNPKQTIAGIIELSKWYHEKMKGKQCHHPTADKHLNNYLEIMMPAMGMSIDAFFSKYNHTPAYTGYVELANRFSGVIIDKDGSPLPHRRSLLDGTNSQKHINGRFLAWQFLSGAIPSDKVEDAIGKNSKILEKA
jgi:hypothetical protein